MTQYVLGSWLIIGAGLFVMAVMVFYACYLMYHVAKRQKPQEPAQGKTNSL